MANIFSVTGRKFRIRKNKFQPPTGMNRPLCGSVRVRMRRRGIYIDWKALIMWSLETSLQCVIKECDHLLKSIYAVIFKHCTDPKAGVLRFVGEVKMQSGNNLPLYYVRVTFITFVRRQFYSAVKKPAIIFRDSSAVSGCFISTLPSLIGSTGSPGNKVMCCLDHSAMGVKAGLSHWMKSSLTWLMRVCVCKVCSQGTLTLRWTIQWCISYNTHTPVGQ